LRNSRRRKPPRLRRSNRERKASAPTQNGDLKRYELKGKIVEVDKEKKRVKVEHDEIKGFMAAMTMWFAVKDDANFGKAEVGDQLVATLVYNSADNRSWLEALNVTKAAKP
jgi:protein SCO1/2